VGDASETANDSLELDDRVTVIEAIDFLLTLDGVTAGMRRELERIKSQVENFPTR
jgi:hypothetical protein